MGRVTASAQVQREGQQVNSASAQGHQKIVTKVSASEEADTAGGDGRAEEYVHQVEEASAG
ncbi:MAG: hypothetical protein BZY75_06505 [SAR202 cluster bacterium Io17-Chloro-G7]|nr:MAG: hypothetical protein BZY75_06505 [SAR202 cluster bacterium Io17-Chloro-G7]